MINKVEDVMNSNTQLTYKLWLDDLSTTPLDDFITIARQFFELLKKENAHKIDKLADTFNDKSKLLVNYANKAVEELEPLLNQIETELKQIGITELPPKMREYKDIKARRVRRLGEDLPDTLYHAIRLTLEEYRNKGLLTKCDPFITLHEGFWYLDYEKLCKQYPSYKRFKEYKGHFELERKEEPWGAFIYLTWATSFFKHHALGSSDSFVKSDMVSSFKRLILYLLTPETTEYETKSQKLLYSFDSKRAVLKIGDKEIPFKKETRKLQLLALLTKRPEGVYYSEVVEELEGADQGGLKNPKNTYYETCRGIETRLLKKSISDFLDYNFNRAKINPYYKKASR